MLPTPAKTPRKRRIEDVSSAARVLFPSRPATIDEVVPTPRKSRTTKNLYTLESFAQHMDENAETIHVYTDSKERVPTPGAEGENPFITKKGKGRAKVTPHKMSKAADAKTQKMNEAVNRDEGMIYLFRGRKLYRKFHDGLPSNASAAEEEEVLSGDDMQVRRQIGYEARRPLTRSSIKPRVLFQAEIQQRNRENGIEEDDEEATTDIEVPIATPSRRKGKSIVQAPMLEATPPPTEPKMKKRMFSPCLVNSADTKTFTEISFDSWTRVKSAHNSSSSSRETKKRGGSPLERETDTKRARSEHSTSSMSLDNF